MATKPDAWRWAVKAISGAVAAYNGGDRTDAVVEIVQLARPDLITPNGGPPAEETP